MPEFELVESCVPERPRSDLFELVAAEVQHRVDRLVAGRVPPGRLRDSVEEDVGAVDVALGKTEARLRVGTWFRANRVRNERRQEKQHVEPRRDDGRKVHE